jgi:small subunit ribosomal protein S4
MRRRASTKRRYKTAFYNKQQLRHFYGKFKEEKFRNLFRSHLVGVYSRNNSFYSTLERRIDMFLFRARHLPTLYAANQFVQHQGVEYNGIIERSPNALVGPGTSLVFDPYF